MATEREEQRGEDYAIRLLSLLILPHKSHIAEEDTSFERRDNRRRTGR